MHDDEERLDRDQSLWTESLALTLALSITLKNAHG